MSRLMDVGANPRPEVRLCSWREANVHAEAPQVHCKWRATTAPRIDCVTKHVSFNFDKLT